jgi:hypothetical protein
MIDLIRRFLNRQGAKDAKIHATQGTSTLTDATVP